MDSAIPPDTVLGGTFVQNSSMKRMFCRDQQTIWKYFITHQVWSYTYLGLFQILLHANVYEKINQYQATLVNPGSTGIKKSTWSIVVELSNSFQSHGFTTAFGPENHQKSRSWPSKVWILQTELPFPTELSKAISVRNACHFAKSVVDLL